MEKKKWELAGTYSVYNIYAYITKYTTSECLGFSDEKGIKIRFRDTHPGQHSKEGRQSWLFLLRPWKRLIHLQKLVQRKVDDRPFSSTRLTKQRQGNEIFCFKIGDTIMHLDGDGLNRGGLYGMGKRIWCSPLWTPAAICREIIFEVLRWVG